MLEQNSLYIEICRVHAPSITDSVRKFPLFLLIDFWAGISV